MNDGTHRVWDLIVKVLGILVALIGMWVTSSQFISEWHLNNRKPYLELRTKFYLEMVETASAITYPKANEDQASNIKRFWQLYVGVSAIVEDEIVERKVSEFSTCLDQEKVKCDRMELEARSIQLANAVRHSLLSSWQVEDLRAVGKASTAP